MVMNDCIYYNDELQLCVNIGLATIQHDKIYLSRCIFLPMTKKKDKVYCRCERFEKN